jgi:hypothetical protein
MQTSEEALQFIVETIEILRKSAKLGRINMGFGHRFGSGQKDIRSVTHFTLKNLDKRRKCATFQPQGVQVEKGEAMAIQVTCKNCNKQLRVKDEYAGRKGKCPACGGVIQIPAAEPDLFELKDEPAVAPKRIAPPPPRPASMPSAVAPGALPPRMS